MTAAALLDRSTRRFWRTVGRRVDVATLHAWLAAPTSADAGIGDRWLAAEAARLGGQVVRDADGGLLPSMSLLDGPQFHAADVHPLIRDFYEHTAHWRMQVRTQWSPWYRPAGAVITRLFARRVEQLALPSHDRLAREIDSEVVFIVDEAGQQLATGWLRTLPSTGDTVYSGCYDIRMLPGFEQPQIHVAFPLQAGNVQVFLSPSVVRDNAVQLLSPPGRFGDPGAYVVVADSGTYAARVPLHERFLVFVDPHGQLRARHDLRLGARPVVRLHYVMHHAASHN
jgi:hypothetical protein